MSTGEHYYQNVLDNIYDGVYFVDRSRKILFWNKGAERITGYSAGEVVGKRCQDEILNHVDAEGRPMCQGRCPIAATLADGLPRHSDMYIRHRDGYRMPVSVRVSPIAEPNGTISGAVQVFNDNWSKEAAMQRIKELEELTLLDPLTGLGNRRYTEVSVRTRLDETRRYGWTFGLLFMDIDHFKHVIDTYGHDVGDEVLRMVAKTLVNGLRPFDMLGRWGGEEFVGIIHNMPEESLGSVAQRCRGLVEHSSLPAEGDVVAVTICVGAALARTDDTVTDLVRRADELMYRGKRAGGNCVHVESPSYSA
jgi:diguanylate cyclase (GGDEF)-like protein/PAS domain S-box-containing protein